MKNNKNNNNLSEPKAPKAVSEGKVPFRTLNQHILDIINPKKDK
jgi:hypothetical protein